MSLLLGTFYHSRKCCGIKVQKNTLPKPLHTYDSIALRSTVCPCTRRCWLSVENLLLIQSIAMDKAWAARSSLLLHHLEAKNTPLIFLLPTARLAPPNQGFPALHQSVAPMLAGLESISRGITTCQNHDLLLQQVAHFLGHRNPLIWTC